MKTMNRKTENKQNRHRVAFLKGGAIIFSLVLISFTVSAQGFWKQLLIESSLGNVAAIMAGDVNQQKQDKTGTTSTSNISKGMLHSDVNPFLQESDAPLELQDWMINNQYFYNMNAETEKDKTNRTQRLK